MKTPNPQHKHYSNQDENRFIEALKSEAKKCKCTDPFLDLFDPNATQATEFWNSLDRFLCHIPESVKKKSIEHAIRAEYKYRMTH